MILKLIAGLMVIISINNYSQSYYDVFSNSLPHSTIKNIDDFESNVEYYGSIDPALLYFYFNLLDKQSSGNNEQIETAEFDLEFSLNNALYFKTSFLKDELKLLDESQYSGGPALETSALIENEQNDVFISTLRTKEKIDSAKQLFYIYLYFSKDTSAVFDSTSEFKSQISQFTNAYVSKFSAAHTLKGKFDNEEKQELLETTFDYYYVFKNSPIYYIKKRTDFNLYEFLIGFYLDSYKENSALRLTFDYGLGNPTENFQDAYYHEFKTYLVDSYTSHKWNTRVEPQMAVGLSGKIQLRQSKGFLSFIQVGASYIFGFSNTEESVYLTPIIEDMQTINDVEYYNRISISDRKNNTQWGFSVAVDIPGYYLTSFIYLGLGVQYSQINYGYDVEIESYSYTKNASSFEEKSEKLTETYSRSFKYFKPFATVNIEATENIYLSVKYFLIKNVWLSAGINYSL
ncbi:MAG: hypothetical protein K9J16_11240 [Melioribacteraceae bacterium]|nr:hypothetical protein [Melioribacteraceae bacterium]MCF8353584.1 hypothetical protein [Melioribacteraceae bacterium]MCF8393507.1 hypothetical protein [Melioribacteraceae bacterium]MCF8419317.1 hypothetical protein [Melioribacteraceae bacterium]